MAATWRFFGKLHVESTCSTEFRLRLLQLVEINESLPIKLQLNGWKMLADGHETHQLERNETEERISGPNFG